MSNTEQIHKQNEKLFMQKMPGKKSKQTKSYLFAMHNFSTFIYNKTSLLFKVKAV